MIKSWSIQSPLWSLSRFILLASASAVAFASRSADAAVIKSIAGHKVLLVYSSEESFRVGDQLAITFEDGTLKATLTLTKLRRGQALAEIKSGTPEEGDAVRLLAAKASVTASPPAAVKTKPAQDVPNDAETGLPFWPKFGAFAVIASYNYNSADVRLTNETTVKTSGSSEGLKFALMGSLRDLSKVVHGARENWIYEFSIGLDRIQATGTGPNEVCKGTNDCLIDLFGYVPAVQIGYVILPHFHQLSVHGGFDVFVPFTVQSNLVDGVALHPLSFYNLGLAQQIRIGRKSFIPIALDFSANVWSYDVILHRYMLSIGYGW